MNLIPREKDKILLHQTCFIAQKRLARGSSLNHTESSALLASQLMELVRDGKHTVSQLMSIGRTILGRAHVHPNVIHTLHYVQVEATFPDGTKLITVHEPISTLYGNIELALYGSFLPIPNESLFKRNLDLYTNARIPGEYMILPGDITLTPNRARISLPVENKGDRPVQIGSHYHFVEVNPLLVFDRKLAFGKRLDIPSGTSTRFEPGESKTVHLVELGGSRNVSGGNRFASGPCTALPKSLLDGIANKDFGHEDFTDVLPTPQPFKMDRRKYADAFGPTTGDCVRLADSSLILEIEKDYTVYGDECVFGGGKVIREGMGQMTLVLSKHALDLVITNAIIIDYTGIIKADIGIKGGYIQGVGKAGNPDVMDGVDPSMIIGVSTEVLSGENHIFVAGGVDTHVHFICPQLCQEALATGITTLIGGGTGPNTGSNATTCTPGPNHIQFMLEATDSIPLNLGFTGKGNCSHPKGLEEQVEAGAVGLKLHEDWGSTPASIDTCLSVCDKYDVQTTLHTDTLNESGFVESTISAFKGRTIHSYHIEGAGGGHAPDIIKLCGEGNVIPSSTNPTRPFTVNTLDEHLDMLMVCHHLSRDIPEDIAFAESRIRGETIGAEDILHDLGAISIISSDSQAMGRIGETITRTWQTASKMKDINNQQSLNDNDRIKRYVAKYTINPAIAHGVSHVVGSIQVGKLADLVMYKPEWFGTKPELIIKGGKIAWAMMGDANASIPTPEPRIGRPMFGSYTTSSTCISFVSKASLQTVKNYKISKKIMPVENCRSIGKKDMKLNDYCPNISVDPETYIVTIDDEKITVNPSSELPMTRNTFLF